MTSCGYRNRGGLLDDLLVVARRCAPREATDEEPGFTRNYWSAIENERKILSPEALARGQSWWSSYSALFNAAAQRLFDPDQGASSTRDHETPLIPGLPQTAGYIRAIMMLAGTLPQVEVDQRVEARLRRQKRCMWSPFTTTCGLRSRNRSSHRVRQPPAPHVGLARNRDRLGSHRRPDTGPQHHHDLRGGLPQQRNSSQSFPPDRSQSLRRVEPEPEQSTLPTTFNRES